MASESTPRRQKGEHPVKCHSDTLRTSPAVKDAWASELSGRINFYGETIDDFIDTLLPSSTPYTLRDDLEATFEDYAWGAGREHLEYDNLVSGFKKLVKPFPKAHKLTFANTYKRQLNFPFDEFITHHHHTAPDISVSFPGKPLGAASWQGISMVIESKSVDKQDPFVRNGQEHTATIEQLAKNARNLMLAHGFLAAFVIGIYGDIVRLVRFDHTCALVSNEFKIKGPDGARLLQKFLWHFTHPVVGDTVVGCDPTVMKLDAESQAWVKDELQRANAKDWEDHVEEIEKGRRVEVYDEKTGRCIPYLLYHILDVNGRLFSRATMVWRAIEDTRIWQDGQLVPDPSRTSPVKPRILKEAWRQLVRTAEAKFYQRLNANILDEDWYGLAKMECGGDLGEFELRWWKETQRRRAEGAGDAKSDSEDVPTGSPSPSFPSASSRLFSSTGSADSPLASSDLAPEHYIPAEDFPLGYPQHQTYSWRLVKGEKNWHHDRSHMRIVIDDVGRPLTRFKNTFELVCAVRDAIRGHRLAWEKAHVLHRDISVGNILIADQLAAEKAFTGFLHDYDYSSMGPDPSKSGDGESVTESSPAAPPQTGSTQPSDTADDPAQFKERTGTYFFMAYEILKSTKVVIHTTCHDLESFYWVLLWVVVRHTEHGHPKGNDLCNEIFRFGSDYQSSASKKEWLTSEDDGTFDIPFNQPLSHLLNGLALLAAAQLPIRGRASKTPMEYEPMLQLFQEAIDMPGWPDKDWRRCTLLDGAQRTGIAPIDSTAKKAKAALSKRAATGSGIGRRQRLPPNLKSKDLRGARSLPPPALARHSKKRSFDLNVMEEDPESQLPGTSTSKPRKEGRSKRQRTNDMGPPPVPVGATSSESGLRRSGRIQDQKRLASGEASK